MSLKEKITHDLAAAMKSRDALRTSTLRMAKAALMNREIEKRGELTEDETLALLRSLVKQRQESVEQYEKGDRLDLAAKESAEIEILQVYLPQAATREEIEQAVARAISESGASSMREMGAVMKAIQLLLSGRSVDNKLTGELVKKRLGG